MTARRQFLAECGKAAAAFVLMACEQDKLLAPCVADETQSPAASPTVRDVYIVDGFTGSQGGTRDNPYSVRGASEFDALLQFLRPQDFLAVHKEGRFKTAGVYRWGQYASRNLGKGWTVDGDYELAIDPDSVTIQDTQPLYCLAGPARRVSGKVRGNHSALADRWTGSLRTGGVLLENGSIDGVTFSDFGALGAETFVAEIVGSGDIVGNLFTEHDPASSDNQVTVFRTMASENGERTSSVRSVHEHNTVNAPGSKLVQAHTIYQSPGLVRFNKSVGADVLFYGDYFSGNGNVTVEENDSIDSIHGVQLKLSPTPVEIAGTFSHSKYTVGWNRFGCSGKQVSLDTCGQSTDTRFMRDFWIHPDLSVENFGATGVRRELSCRMAA